VTLPRKANVLVVSTCFLAACANDTARPWSADVLSPDWEWRAVAESSVVVGPGTNAAAAWVHLDGRGGSKSPSILDLSDAVDDGPPAMRWLSNRHLLIVVKRGGHPPIDRIDRTSGVEVTIRYGESACRVARPVGRRSAGIAPASAASAASGDLPLVSTWTSARR
jgi:hypothetical protein